MDNNQCQDHTNIDGTDGSGCTYSSHSILSPCSESSHDTPSHHETSHSFLATIPIRVSDAEDGASGYKAAGEDEVDN